MNAAVRWLIGLQNRDGGFPTFCRGWGTLPFDRSAPDITAHCVRALRAWREDQPNRIKKQFLAAAPLEWTYESAFYAAKEFLHNSQHPDGSWLPLWFGNQHAPDDINPTYGTARVLAAFRDAGLVDDPATQRGIAWLLANQNDDGGWGGMKGTPTSVEETALAVEILCDLASENSGTWRGVAWLIQAVGDGSYLEPSPIGFYFAKLWYFERVYPVIFTVAALRAARRALNRSAGAGHDGAALTASREP